MSRSEHRVVAISLAMVLLASCTSLNLSEHCHFSTSPSLVEADSKSLGVIFGAPRDFLSNAPTLAIYSPSMANSEASVTLELVEAPIPWPEELDETPCGDLDWRTYAVSTDSEQWKAFWSRPRPVQFQFQLGFPGLNSPRRLPAASFAVALVDTSSGTVLKSCGCYWT
jgi:hypothetical protein